jgi:hypothetical protein
MTILIDQIGQIVSGNVVLGSKEDLKNGQAVIKVVDAILFEQFYKLRFFLFMDGLRSHGVSRSDIS